MFKLLKKIFKYATVCVDATDKELNEAFKRVSRMEKPSAKYLAWKEEQWRKENEQH